MTPLLEVSAVNKRFGGIVALSEVSFALEEGKITALIGPNGAGKTTMFNCITGMYVPTSGSIRFDGHELAGLGAHQISRAGVARTFQNLALFNGLTVLENLLAGAYLKGSSGLLAGALKLPSVWREERHAEEEACRILDYLGLTEVAGHLPSSLPYGQQKRVEFGRAMMQKSRLILLDEPMAGMSRAEKDAMTSLILKVRAELGITFLIVEHDIPAVMSLSDRVVVFDVGRKIADGEPHVIRTDAKVIAAYLGTDETYAH